MVVPPEIQEHICTYIEDNLVPDIKSYVKGKYPKIYGVPIEEISIERIDFCQGPFKLLFNAEQHYDLYQVAIILEWKKKRYLKVMARHTVGAAIRICKDIRKEEHADRITEIVNNSFTPEEHPDPTGLLRRWFLGYYKGLV